MCRVTLPGTFSINQPSRESGASFDYDVISAGISVKLSICVRKLTNFAPAQRLVKKLYFLRICLKLMQLILVGQFCINLRQKLKVWFAKLSCLDKLVFRFSLFVDKLTILSFQFSQMLGFLSRFSFFSNNFVHLKVVQRITI